MGEIEEIIDRTKEANDRAKKLREEYLIKGSHYWIKLKHGRIKIVIATEDLKGKLFGECGYDDLWRLYQYYKRDASERRFQHMSPGGIPFLEYRENLKGHLDDRIRLNKETGVKI